MNYPVGFEHKAVMTGSWDHKRTGLGIEYKPFVSSPTYRGAVATRPVSRPVTPPRPRVPEPPKNRPFTLRPGEIVYAQVEEKVVPPEMVRAAKWAVHEFERLQFKAEGGSWPLVYIRWIHQMPPHMVDSLTCYGVPPDDHTRFIKTEHRINGTVDPLYPSTIYLSDHLRDPYDVICTAAHECCHTWQVKHRGLPDDAADRARWEEEADRYGHAMVDYARNNYRR